MDKTAFSRGFYAGSFSAAYETEILPSEDRIDAKAKERELPGESSDPQAFRDGFALGFFSSYETHEIPAEHRDTIKALRAEHGEGD